MICNVLDCNNKAEFVAIEIDTGKWICKKHYEKWRKITAKWWNIK